MVTKILTDTCGIERIKSFQTEIENIPHYVFTAKIIENTPSDDIIPEPVWDQGYTLTNLYDSMVFGKKILPSDLCPMIPRSIWTSNTIYSQYSFNNSDLLDETFYTAVQYGSNYHVYKCLSNNGNTASVNAPSGTDTTIFETADGYVWKYMYTFDQFQDNKFATTNYMPVIENETIKNSAVPGTIDVIQVNDVGSEYTNYLISSFTANGIRYNGNDFLYAIDSDASIYNNYYNSCTIKITSGVAEGLYRRITNYYLSGSDKVIELESPFSIAPAAGDSYEIMPTVEITGDGNESIQAHARAIIDTDTNLIDYIEVLNVGEGYRKATCEVLADNTVNVVTEASVTPSVSPIMGHGYDPLEELGAKNLSISIIFNQDENGSVSFENDYRTVGIIKEPLYDNLKLVINPSTQVGNFSTGEGIIQYRNLQIPTFATIDKRSHFVTTTNNNVYEYVQANDLVLFTNGTRNFLSTVDYILDNNYFRIKDFPDWNGTNIDISVVKPLANGIIEDLDTNYIIMSSVTNNVSNTNPCLVGLETFATCQIDFANSESLTINTSDINEFRTFNQLTLIEGLYTSNVTFQQDEVVYQGTSNAVVHSTSDTSGTDTVNVLNIYGEFNSNSQIVSNSSLAAFSMTNKYPGDLKLNSGKIIYIENISPITRSENTSETVKIILSF